MEYLDFHVHTTLSDGMQSPERVIAEAKRCGISILAITDHNLTSDLTQYRQDNPNLTLVQGSEISCIYSGLDQAEHEVHVIALGFDPEHPKIQEVFRHNQPNRRPYIESILKRLEECGIHIGSYDQLVNDYPQSRHVGRSHIAKKMQQLGYVKTAEEAFDEYIGDFGERKAYVKSSLHYISLEECVDAIISSGGVPILCHLFYYKLSDADNRTLVQYFKKLTGDYGGIETAYGCYSESQRKQLCQIADEFRLMHSAGSDYHGRDSFETLDCKFACSDFQPLLDALSMRLKRSGALPNNRV